MKTPLFTLLFILGTAPFAQAFMATGCSYVDGKAAYASAGHQETKNIRQLLIKDAASKCINESATPEKCGLEMCFDYEYGVSPVQPKNIQYGPAHKKPVVQQPRRQANPNDVPPGCVYGGANSHGVHCLSRAEQAALEGVYAERERQRQDKIDQLIRDHDMRGH